MGLVIRHKIRRDIVVEVMFCTSTKQNSNGEADDLRGSVIVNDDTLVSKMKSPHDTEAWTIVIFVKTPECCSLPGSGAHCWSLPFSPGVCGAQEMRILVVAAYVHRRKESHQQWYTRRENHETVLRLVTADSRPIIIEIPRSQTSWS